MIFICSSVKMAAGVPQGAITAGDLSRSDTTTIRHANPEHGRHIQAAMMGFTAPEVRKGLLLTATDISFLKTLSNANKQFSFLCYFEAIHLEKKKKYFIYFLPGFIFH